MSSAPILTMCTSNRHKAEEVARILGRPVEPVTISFAEVQELDPARVSRPKAEQAARALGRPVIVDDTALMLESLGGFPGALVAWALDAGGPAILFRMLPDRADARALAVTSIGYCDGERLEVFTGEVAGSVVAEPRGAHGFGFDPVFVPAGETRTLAEMAPHEKDLISPRRLALEKLRQFLDLDGAPSP